MIPQSTRTGTLARIVFATFLAVPAFAAGPVSLLQLSQTGGSLIEGDKKFSTFSMSGLTNVINPADILVETVALPGGFLGLSFSGIMSPPGADVDFAIFYTAETISGLPLISEIGQSFVLGGGGAGGFVIIGETVFDQGFFMGNAVAQSSIGFADSMDPAGELIQGDQLIINPPRNKVWVDKDIHLIPLNTNSSVSLSKLVQVFCQNQIVVTCPTNKTVGCGPWTFDLPTAINACCSSNLTITVVGTVTNQVNPCTFCATRTWAINDACGNITTNCAQTVCFTRDITPPVITCPTNLNLGCNPPTLPACSLTQVSVTDDCGPVNLFCTFSDATNGCVRLRTIVYTAIDQCSNLAACTQLITWTQDTNPPVFTLCPTNLDLGCNPATIPGCNLGLVAAQDDCGPVGITCASVDTTNGCTRLRTITYTAIDICTNRAFCTQLITWKVDTTPPVLIGVPTNRNFQCFADFLALTPAVVTALDNCDGTNVILRVISAISGTCPMIVQTCWTAFDQCGNSNTACVVYTIRDTIPPIIRCPTNIIVGCDSNIPPCAANLAGFLAMGGFASDNCDTNLDYFCVDGPLIGNQIVRTHTVCDDCTNCASCTQIITFVGANVPPTIYCPPDRTVECTNDVPPCLATLAEFLAAGGWVSTTNLLSFTCVTGPFIGSHCDGSVIRTYTITDRCSNTVSCQQRILVRDTTPPNIHCGPDKEVQCGTDWFFDIPTASDNCDGPNIPVVLVSTVTNIAVPRCPGIFSVTRTWRATDSCSNNAFCNQTVTIVDTEPPNITCEQDKEELCGIAWAFDIPTAVDKCDLNNVLIVVVSTVTNVSIPRCPAIFSVTRTWRATDTCSNSSFCNQTVTIVDIEPPNITCEQDKEVQCGTDWAFDIPTAVDKCDLNNVLIEVVATVTNTAVPRCPKIFSVTRTWRTTDTCGNSAFCNQTVTIVDTEPPNLTCGADKEVQCGTDWAFDIPTAVDKCDLNNVLIEVVATVTNTAVPRCPKIFSVTRTWRTTDTCGNSAFCNQTVTIVDTEPPNLTCGADKQAQCGTDWTFDIPTAVDKCDLNNVLIEVAVTVTNVATPRCPKVFSVTRIWRATDTCGNNSFCSQTVTIVDTLPPSLTCGSDKEAECGTDWAFDIPTAVDLCDRNNVLIEVVATVTNTAVPQCPRIFSVTRTWRSTDTCGNASFCNQTVTIVDTTPPNLTCAHDQIIECGNPFAFTRPTAVDACDGTNVVIEITSTTTNLAVPRCPGLFTVRRTWRAYDTCTNETFCSQTITIVDTLPPNLTCANSFFVECGTAWMFTRPNAVDLCDGTNVVITVLSTVTNVLNPRCPGLTTAMRTWSATDSCSNSSVCSQTITLVDTTPPNLTCASDQIVECGSSWAFQSPSALDICDGTNVVVAIISTATNVTTPRCPGLLTAIRTWRATDNCTNTSFCSQTITIVDTTPPNLTCAGDQIVECGNPFAFTRPTAVDVCDSTNVVIEITSTVTNAASPRCPGLFSVRRTWRAYDTCTNETFCSQTITLVDTTPPNLTCSANQLVECGHPFAFTPPFAVDACDGTNVVIRLLGTVTTAASPRCPGLTNVTRTWSATDTCGNSNVCSQTITLVDTTPPELVCANNGIFECGLPWNFTPPFAVDICDGTNVTIAIVNTVTNSLCGRSFSTIRTWRASDSCGNSVLCSQSILVVDTTSPSLACAQNRTVECGDPFAFTPPTANDICDGTNVTITIVNTITNPACGNTFSATRTWKATDACTNMSFCSQTIYVVDTTPPALSCSPNRTVECGTPFTFTPPNALDSCDGTNVTITILSTTTNGLCGTTFSAFRIWQASDRCGNRAQCSQTIRVVDTEPPVLAGVPGTQFFYCFGDVPSPPPVTALDFCDTNVTVTFSAMTNGRCPFIITRCWTAVDDCGNSAQACQSITVSPLPLVVVGPTNQTVCPGNPATLCAVISGGCPATQQWYRDGVAIPGATNVCYTIPNVAITDAGQYCIAVTGSCQSVTNCARLEVCMAALGDFVWNDLDHDGIQDFGESGVQDVLVQLFDCLDHPVQTKFTDEFGGYLFTGLTAGTYRVTFALSAGYKFTIPNVGNDALDSDADTVTGRTGCYTLAANETNRTVDAGIFQPAALGDFVWLDSNTNGVQDGIELGVSNVLVKLMDCSGNVLATTNTDANGFYLFTDLGSGNYSVMFNPPAGYLFTGQDLGGDDARDSDANPATGMTACYTLASGQTNLTVDAGLFIPIPCIPVYGAPQTVLHYKLDACVADSSFNELTPVVTVGCLGGAAGSVFSALDGSHSCNPGFSGVAFCAKASSSATFSETVYSKAFQFTATLIPASGGYVKLTSLTFYHRSAFVAQFQSGSTADNNRLSKLAVRIKDGATVVYEQTGLNVPTNWTLVTIDLGGANLATNVQKQYVVQLAAYSPIPYAGSSKYIYDVDEVKLNAACGVIDPACFPCVASIAGTVYRDCEVWPGLPHIHDDCNHAHGWCCRDGRDHSHCNHRYDYCNHDGKDHSGCRHERGWDTQDGRDHSSCNHAGDRCDRDTRDHSQCRHSLNICLHDGGTHYECSHARGYCTGDGRDHSHCNHRYTYCALDGQDHSTCRHERGWCSRDGLNHSTCDHSGGRCDRETRNHSACNHTRNSCIHDGHDHGDMANCGHDRGICRWDGHDHWYCDHQSHVCNWDGNDHQSCHHDGGWCNYDGNNHSSCDHAHDRCNYAPANACQDGATGLAGVTVQLKDIGGTILATTTTAADGSYAFTNLAPGTYLVMVVPPTNSIQTVDPDGVLDHMTVVLLSTCQMKRKVDFGYKSVPPCVPSTFDLTGNSSSSGTAGNLRTFSAGSVTVRASAFSRTTNGTWATAWLGSYDEGLGVTDGSEGDGSNDRHVVDNVGRFNYVLFEFSQAVVVNRAYLDHVISDSDITVWIGNFPDPFNNHLTLSDALLGSFALTEDSPASDDNSRWAPFNGAAISGNTLVIAARPSGSPNDQFKISKVDICKPPPPCAPALRLTTACVSASALGQPINFSGTISNAGNTTVTNITVTHSIAGVVRTIATLPAGKATNYSGSFTPASCGSFAATITAAGNAACNGSHVSATVFSTCFVPCPPPACPPATFDLTGDSADSGTAGNIRSFSAGGVTVRVSGFSRTTSGTWATAWLGSYDEGLGVTDGSEGDGSNDRHVVDNVGRFNYVLFEFNQPVVVNRAYLDHVISDSDIAVWIGNFPDPFNNHLTLSDALLGSFALTEESPASDDNSRWALFNGAEVSGNTLVIAATPAGSLNDQFKISKLDICTPPAPCVPALRLTTACVSASALGQPINFSGTVSNAGNTTVTNITVTHSIAGVVRTIATLPAGKTTNYSGSFIPASCGSFAATITATGEAACHGSNVTATLSSTCSVPCTPACPPATFDLTGDSADSGTAGNIRSFSAGGVTVRVSGFSRTTSGTWATAWLGSYDEGLGVTDGSEGDGSNDRHVVDNVGRFNYVLFEFNQPVVVNRAYLDHVISDSDITVWIGNFPDPFNNHLTLSDALLASFALTEDSPASNDNSRWAPFNGAQVSGNTLVIAAETSGSLNDQFKISKLDICGPARSCPLFIRPLGEACLLEWPAELSSGCVLESTTSLMPPVTWSVMTTNPPNPYMITNSPQTGTRFYRIRMQ